MMLDLMMQAPLALVSVVPMAGGDGLLDWGNTKIGEATTVVRGAAALLALVFMIMAYVRARGSMAAVIAAGIAAAIMLFFVWNITEVRGRVENEIDSAPRTGTVTTPVVGAVTAGR